MDGSHKPWCVTWFPTYRQVGQSRGPIEADLHRCFLIISGIKGPWPGRWDGATGLTQEPIGFENLGEVSGEAATVVHDHTQLLDLWENSAEPGDTGPALTDDRDAPVPSTPSVSPAPPL